MRNGAARLALERERAASTQQLESIYRQTLRLHRFTQEAHARVHRFVTKIKGTPMHAYEVGRLQIVKCGQGAFGGHVLRLHHPGRLVGAQGQARGVDSAKRSAYRAKASEVHP